MPEQRRPLHPDPTESVNITHPQPDEIKPAKKKYPHKKQSDKNPKAVAAGRLGHERRQERLRKQAFFTDSRED